ncbi:unnamed protein product [Ilex paraguariensis]|uniref:Uncharacterized protein n=1 Tax=Ilex paraguariensis TaxID=185542 RepID=A0ABC8R1G4_9AQUA
MEFKQKDVISSLLKQRHRNSKVQKLCDRSSVASTPQSLKLADIQAQKPADIQAQKPAKAIRIDVLGAGGYTGSEHGSE